MSAIRDAWRRLWRYGWSLVPLEAGGKKARVAWTQYQHERATGDELKQWLAEWPNANPGVITGKVSGIVVLDIDGTEGMVSVANMGELPRTPKVRTAKGWHYFFAYPQLAQGQRVITKAGIGQNVDIRGDGGYVVGEGGVHETGVIYTWEVSPDDCPLAPLPDWLAQRIIVSTPDPLAQSQSLRVPSSVEQQGGARARAYAEAALRGEVDRVESAQEGTKHDTLLSAAARLGGLIPVLSEQEIEQALYGAVADRADDRRAALKTIRDGVDFGARRPRTLPDEPAQARPNASQPDVEATPEPTPEPTQQQAHRWTPRPIGDLTVTTEHIDWIFEGYIAPQMQTLYTALWKSGKTTTLAHLLKVLDGSEPEFVGQRVRHTKVLGVVEERDRHWVTRRDELGLGNHIHLITQPFVGNASDSEWGALIAHCAEQVVLNEYELVVFDSLPNLWCVRNENDNAEVKRAVVLMNQITDAGAAVLMTAHPSKMDGPVGTSTRGASQLQTMVDIIIEMRRMTADNLEDTRRVLNGLGRFDETPNELVIRYLPGFGFEPVGTRSEASKEYRKQVLWDILPYAAPGWTVEDVLAEWPQEPKPPRTLIKGDLEFLARDGIEIQKRGDGTRHNPFTYYRAAANAQWQRTA